MSAQVSEFLRSESGRFSGRYGKRKPRVVAGLNRDDIELDVVSRGGRRGGPTTTAPAAVRSCVICVGSTGSGKSSTVSRFTKQRAPSSAGFERMTTECGLYRPKDVDGPLWVDTVGWDDQHYEDQQSFQDILRFISANGITHVAAIIWNIIPNVRKDALLTKQAKFINMFKPKDIWKNVIIVCKQSMNPERDGIGAIKAAEEYNRDIRAQVIGYRFYQDESLSAEQKVQFSDERTRHVFNVRTDDEVRGILADCLGNCGQPVALVFRQCVCMDCGDGPIDPRLMNLFCHVQMQRVHPGVLELVHPLSVEAYHASEHHVAEHDGVLRRAWYAPLLGRGKHYTCCGRRAGKPGCIVKWACCKDPVSDDPRSGCMKRYACCKKDPFAAKVGCEHRFTCCGRRAKEPGCKETCVKCAKPWGTPTVDCFRKEHNVTDYVPPKQHGASKGQHYSSTEFKPAVAKAVVKTVWGLPPIVLPKPW